MVQMKVCSLDIVPSGSMKQFYVKEHEVLVINQNGQYFCLDGRCTHAGAPLVDGKIDGETLTCPWHKSQFRITDGTVIRGPAEKQLKVYAVTVRDSALFIEI
jgi:nitrite reductase/ring-hydroxylating ferredoxin subunit